MIKTSLLKEEIIPFNYNSLSLTCIKNPEKYCQPITYRINQKISDFRGIAIVKGFCKLLTVCLCLKWFARDSSTLLPHAHIVNTTLLDVSRSTGFRLHVSFLLLVKTFIFAPTNGAEGVGNFFISTWHILMNSEVQITYLAFLSFLCNQKM